MLKTPIIDAREIHPLTDFLRNSKAHIARLKETGGPEVLTVNGRATGYRAGQGRTNREADAI